VILKPLWSSWFRKEDLWFLKGLKDKCANSFLIISAFNESKVQKETRHHSPSILGEFVEIYVYIALQVSPPYVQIANILRLVSSIMFCIKAEFKMEGHWKWAIACQTTCSQKCALFVNFWQLWHFNMYL
jgi:hypothetical protein